MTPEPTDLDAKWVSIPDWRLAELERAEARASVDVERLAAALRNVENETFVAALYRHGVVDSTVTNENVMDVLQRAADRGVLPVEAVLRAHAEARAEATPPPLDVEAVVTAMEDEGVVQWSDDRHRADFLAALTKPDPEPAP